MAEGPAASSVGRRLSLSALPILKYRNYRLFWSGQVVSLIGTWMQITAQGYLVYQLTGSEAMLGIVSAVGSLPILFFSLIGGVYADRTNKRNLLILTQSTLSASALILAVLVQTGWVRPSHIIVLAIVNGIVNAFDMPARQSFVLEMVEKDDLMSAIGFNSTLFNTARILGPAVAGVTIERIGLSACYYVNAFSFIAVLISLFLIRGTAPAPTVREGSPWQDLRAGLVYAAGNPTLLTLFALVAVNSIFGSPYTMLLPVFAEDVLGTGAHGLGWLMSATGVGALLAGAMLASVGSRFDRRCLLLSGGLAYSVLMVLFAQSRLFELSVLLLAGIGWGMITHNATANTIVQLLVPDGLRGRVISLWSLMLLGLTPLGSYQAGRVAEAFGAPVSVALGGAVCALSCVVVLGLRWRHLRVSDGQPG